MEKQEGARECKEHDHRHSHDHDHDHGHAHDHGHRESFVVAGGEAFLEAHVHDQAATVSIAVCPVDETPIVFESLAIALSDIAAEVEIQGGIVGHIKAFARQDGSFAHASVTEAHRKPDLEGDVAVPFGADADVQLVAIALLISQDELVSICKRAVAL